MHTYVHDLSELASYIQDEVVLDTPLGRGDNEAQVKCVQEWLIFHRYGVLIDGDFGQVTEAVVRDFQARKGLPTTGVVDEACFAALTAPMRTVLLRRNATGSAYRILTGYARAHHRRCPIEVGGDNSGPWVRLYMNGAAGFDQAWCAGFVRFLMRQAYESLGQSLPIDGHVGCDEFVDQAKGAGLFVSEADAEYEDLPAGTIFATRSPDDDRDWIHTGVVTRAYDSCFTTIEGNASGIGPDPDGRTKRSFEVCSRALAYQRRDFILLER